MSLLAKLMDKRLGAYQRELIEIHYAEVRICTARSGAGGTTTAATSR